MGRVFSGTGLTQLCKSLSGDPVDVEQLCKHLSKTGRPGIQALCTSIIGHGLHNIVFTQLPATAPIDGLKSALRPEVDRQASISLLHEKVATDFSQDMRQLGIPFLMLKGTPLAYLYYPEPHLRPRGDIDVLVPENKVQDLHQGLVQRGFRCEVLVTPMWKAKFLTTQFICTLPALPVDIDIHWQISNTASLGQTLSFEELNADSICIDKLSTGIKAPKISHTFFIACIHWVAEPSKRLIWLYDLHILNAQMSGQNWDELVATARKTKCSAILLDCLEQANAWFGTCFHGDSVAQLRAHIATGPKEPTRRLIKGSGKNQARTVDFLSFNWKHRLQLLWTLLFPPYSYLQRQFPNWERSKMTYLQCYVKRFARVLSPRGGPIAPSGS